MFKEMLVKGFDHERGIKEGDIILFKFPLGPMYRVCLVQQIVDDNHLLCKMKNCNVNDFTYSKICDLVRFNSFEEKIKISDIKEDTYTHIYKDHVAGTFLNSYKAGEEVYDIFDPNDGGGPAVRYLTVMEASDTVVKATEMFARKSTFVFTPEDENVKFFTTYEYAENFLKSYDEYCKLANGSIE